jgi:hypothetical protein
MTSTNGHVLVVLRPYRPLDTPSTMRTSVAVRILVGVPKKQPSQITGMKVSATMAAKITLQISEVHCHATAKSEVARQRARWIWTRLIDLRPTITYELSPIYGQNQQTESVERMPS